MAKSNAERQREYRARLGANTGHPGRPVTAPCGTPSAYKRHLAKGEPADDLCREAHAKAIKDYRDSRKSA